MNVSLLFRRCPDMWGYRGDPHLWNELKWSFLNVCMPKTAREFTFMIETAFKASTGVSIATKEHIYLERFSLGGMSSGMVSASFWREKAIPFLLETGCRLGLEWAAALEESELLDSGLWIEDGTTLFPEANSYRDVATFRWFVEEQGNTVKHLSDSQCEELLLIATDEIDRLEPYYKGRKREVWQPLAWPREDVWDVELADSLMTSKYVPRLIEYAQLSIAYEQIFCPIGSKARAKKKLGILGLVPNTKNQPLEFVPAFSPSNALLAPLFATPPLSAVK